MNISRTLFQFTCLPFFERLTNSTNVKLSSHVKLSLGVFFEVGGTSDSESEDGDEIDDFLDDSESELELELEFESEFESESESDDEEDDNEPALDLWRR